MAEIHSATNHARREWTWRARGLNRQLERASQVLELHPGDVALATIRDLLAAATQRCERGEVGAGEADAIASLASLALDARAGGR